MRFVTTLFCLLFSVLLSAQSTIVGRVITHRGEPVGGVNILCIEEKNGTITDSLGNFKITCKTPCTLEVSHLNYIKERHYLKESHGSFFIILRNRYNNLKEVVVTGFATTGSVSLNVNHIERIPAILGEKDILKYLATLPGIITTNPFNSGIYVRGGNSSENGFFINNISIANPDHLTGILSTFDPYVLSNSVLYKSGFPARYNGYLSSYLNMHPEIGSKQKHEHELTLGLISSALKSKGVIVKDRISYAISLRTSYLQEIARIYNKTLKESEESNQIPEYLFNDITATVDLRLSDKWRTNVFALFTTDKLKMKLSEQIRYNFDWYTFSGNLSSIYSPNNSSSLTFQLGGKSAFSEGSAVGRVPMGGGNRYYTLQSGIVYANNISENVRLNMGTKYEHNHFETANREDGLGNILIRSSHNKFNLLEYYIDIDFKLNDYFTLNGGLNYQYYSGQTKSHTLSPRVKLNYIDRDLTVWVDYAKTTQYLSLYPYFTVKTPVDIRYPLDKGNKPAICHQFSVGVNRDIKRSLSLSFGIFYKKMEHVKDFIYDTNIEYAVLSDRQIEGVGNAKGAEFSLTFNHKKIYARANYTLSESKRKFTEINEGKAFFPPYDVKHNIVLNFSYEFSSCLMFNTLWTYSSGVHTTFPVGVVVAHNISDPNNQAVLIPIYRERYNYRLPPNHRLDANLDYTFFYKKNEIGLSVGAYNIYNQSNPSFIYFTPEEGEKDGDRFNPKSKVILPFIPYISLKMKL